VGKNNGEGIFEKCGAVLKGHFILTAWEHSDTYLKKEKIYGDPVVFENLCRAIAREVSSKSINIDAVVGPVPRLAERVAYFLGEIYHKTVVHLSVEKDEMGKRVFGQGPDQDLSGKNVLIVDDITITGESIRQIIRAVTVLKRGRVVIVAVICNRGDVTPYNLYGLPVISLSRIRLKTWFNNCPLCKAIVPINVDIERGREFVEAHPGYPAR